MNRRRFLEGAGALGVGMALGGTGARAQEARPLPNGAGFYRFKLGTYTLTVVSDGQTPPGRAFPNWGANPGRQAEFEAALREHFLDPDRFINNFNPMVIDTGQEKILVDTGRGQVGRLLEHLGYAGIRPEEISAVFITHAHPDHIGGLLLGGRPLFPRARLLIGEAELRFWLGQANPPANLLALRDRFTPVAPGTEIAPGVTVFATYGHTPGHLAVQVRSQGETLWHLGDAGGHYVLSFRFPDHYLGFDMDPAQAVATRARLWAQAAAEGIQVVGYHFAWPGVGYVRRRGEAYEFVPAFFVF